MSSQSVPGARVSLCLIARDEADLIGACLRSVRDAVDEIVVVDTGSQDDTARIAVQHGARVVPMSWGGDFSAARNRALAESTGDWILVLDADERLAPGAAEALRAAVQRGGFDCGLLPLHNASRLDATPAEILSGEARRGEPVMLARLLRRTSSLRWEGLVHETVGAWLEGRPVARLPIDLLHLGNVPELRAARNKDLRNLELLRRRCAVEPTNAVARAYLARELLRSGDEEAAWREIDRAWSDLLSDPTSRVDPVPVATLRATLALARDDAGLALGTVLGAEARGASHPNLDLLGGSALSNLGRLDEAQVRLERCLARDGDAVVSEPIPGATGYEARYLRAEARLFAGDLSGAADDLGQVLLEKPDHLMATVAQAELRVRRGDGLAALALLEPVLQRAPMDGWLVAAAATLHAGHPDRARDLLAQARKLHVSPVVRPQRAELRVAVQAELDARSFLDELTGGVRIQVEETVEGLLAQGEVHFGAGVLDQAAFAFMQVLTLELRHAEGWLDLAVTLLQAGSADLAERTLKIAMALLPQVTDLVVQLAELQVVAGAPDRAARTLRDELARHPDDPALIASLGALGVEGLRGAEALIVGASDGPLEAALRQRGLRPRWAQDDVVAALSDSDDAGDPVVITDLLERAAPTLLVVPETHPHAETWTEIARSLGITVSAGAIPESLPAPPPRVSRPPVLSVLAPTYDRAECVRNLLDLIALQDLEPSLFEVIVVDDGSPTDTFTQVGDLRRPYALTTLRQDNAGPAAARNTGLAHCHGRWLVIYNDDALPALDNLRRHLVGQAGADAPEAILGTFDFIDEVRDRPLIRLLERSTFLFEYTLMKPGELHSSRFFYTCNISMPLAPVQAVGGFDAVTFHRAICEDVELGMRLERDQGIQVRYDPDIVALHDHDLDVGRYRRRSYYLGYYHIQTWRQHPDEMTPWACGPLDPHSERTWNAIRALIESRDELGGRASLAAAELERVDVRTDADRERVIELLKPSMHILLAQDSARGQVAAIEGWGDTPRMGPEDLTGELTSVIIPNLNGLPHLCWTVESLRRTADGPVELIVVDNGSTDGSLEWLQAQDDLVVLPMGRNLGAPAARNHGVAASRGRTLVMCDNDILFTPGWRKTLLAHLGAWPDVGMVGPRTDVVVGPQKVEVPALHGEDLDAFSQRWHEEHAGEHHYVKRLILFFIAMRREVIDRIGGIDERFGPWGFEDDDFTVRAATAGFKLRIADDCYVRHLGSRTNGNAGLDYVALLHRNWERFKRKWGMNMKIPFGQPFDSWALAERPFDPEAHHTDLSAYPAPAQAIRLLGPPRGLEPGLERAPTRPMREASPKAPVVAVSPSAP